VYLTPAQGVDPGVGVLTPENMQEGSKYVLTPLKCHILSFKTVVNNVKMVVCKFHIIKDERYVKNGR